MIILFLTLLCGFSLGVRITPVHVRGECILKGFAENENGLLIQDFDKELLLVYESHGGEVFTTAFSLNSPYNKFKICERLESIEISRDRDIEKLFQAIHHKPGELQIPKSRRLKKANYDKKFFVDYPLPVLVHYCNGVDIYELMKPDYVSPVYDIVIGNIIGKLLTEYLKPRREDLQFCDFYTGPQFEEGDFWEFTRVVRAGNKLIIYPAERGPPILIEVGYDEYGKIYAKDLTVEKYAKKLMQWMKNPENRSREGLRESVAYDEEFHKELGIDRSKTVKIPTCFPPLHHLIEFSREDTFYHVLNGSFLRKEVLYRKFRINYKGPLKEIDEDFIIYLWKNYNPYEELFKNGFPANFTLEEKEKILANYCVKKIEDYSKLRRFSNEPTSFNTLTRSLDTLTSISKKLEDGIKHYLQELNEGPNPADCQYLASVLGNDPNYNRNQEWRHREALTKEREKKIQQAFKELTELEKQKHIESTYMQKHIESTYITIGKSLSTTYEEDLLMEISARRKGVHKPLAERFQQNSREFLDYFGVHSPVAASLSPSPQGPK